MAKSELKLKALAFRKAGKSVGEIKRALGISKSTASYWCREVNLTDKQKKFLRDQSTIAGHKGRMIGAEMNRQKKLDSIERNFREAARLVNVMSERDLLISGASLYWGEGSKSESTSGFVFVNSDPDMILFIKSFLEKSLKVSKDRFFCTVQINEIHKPRINKILNFWSTLLQLPTSQFSKPYYIKVKPNKVYENFENYYGILRLKVKKSGELKYKVLGIIKAFKENLSG